MSDAQAEAAAVESAVKADKGHPKPLPAEQVIKHPAFTHSDWNLEPTRSGKTKVALDRRGGPFEISWEIHGEGPVKVVWIMGLGGLKTAWKRQTKYFGHTNGQTYSSLILDNRGIGTSDKPSTRYSTTEMARDVIDVLTAISWLDPSSPKRDLNIAGISMGGMICQELGLLIPNHLQSLSLISTAPRLVRTVPFIENLRQRINMFVPRHIDVQLEEIAHRLFSKEFLAQPDTDSVDPKFNYPTVRDRFAAGELQKRMDKEAFPRKGFMLQAIAAGWHHKSPAQLKDMADKVGRDRLAVLHGTADRMLTYPHFELMREDVGGESSDVTFKVWEGVGHVPLWEKEIEFNDFMEALFQRTAKIT